MKFYEKNPRLIMALFATLVVAVSFCLNGFELNASAFVGLGVMGMLIKEEAPDFDTPIAAGATSNLRLPIENPMSLDGVLIRGVGYTANTTELDLKTVIDEVRILADQDTVFIVDPTYRRKWEDFLNANSDTLPLNSLMIMFNNFLNPTLGWGVGDFKQLTLQVKMKNPFPANTACTALKAYLGYHPLAGHKPRGNVLVEAKIPVPKTPVAGWNKINDLPYQEVSMLAGLLFDNPAITEVRISRGGRKVYHLNKAAQLAYLCQNPLFKVPSTCTHADVSGQAVASTGPFPVVFNDFGPTDDMMPFFEGDVRQTIKVEYYWDTNVNAVADFNIWALALQRDPNIQRVGSLAAARG